MGFLLHISTPATGGMLAKVDKFSHLSEKFARLSKKFARISPPNHLHKFPVCQKMCSFVKKNCPYFSSQPSPSLVIMRIAHFEEKQAIYIRRNFWVQSMDNFE